jgi:hypothetical protein
MKQECGRALDWVAGVGEKRNPLSVPGIPTLFLGIPVGVKKELFELSNTAAGVVKLPFRIGVVRARFSAGSKMLYFPRWPQKNDP